MRRRNRPRLRLLDSHDLVGESLKGGWTDDFPTVRFRPALFVSVNVILAVEGARVGAPEARTCNFGT